VQVIRGERDDDCFLVDEVQEGSTSRPDIGHCCEIMKLIIAVFEYCLPSVYLYGQMTNGTFFLNEKRSNLKFRKKHNKKVAGVGRSTGASSKTITR
jgi:hypothetical protein